MRRLAKAPSAGSTTKAAMLGALLALAMLFALAPQAFAADQSYLPLGSFGSEGTGNGEMQHPRRIAVEESSGNVLVADRDNGRIQVFAPNATGGDYLTQFGSGTLDEPFGIAVDQSSGDVYVTDLGAEEVFKFNSDGAPTPTYTLDAGFASPAKGTGAAQIGDFEADVAVDRTSDEILIADPGNNLVKRFGSNGAFISSFDGSDSPDGAFKGLLDLDVAPNGDVYVVDSEGPVFVHCGGDPDPCPGNTFWEGAQSRVDRYTSAGAHAASIQPLSQTGVGLVAVDPGNSQIVLVNLNPQAFIKISVLRSDGSELARVGMTDSYTSVPSLAVDGGSERRLYLTTDKIQQEHTGQVIGRVGFETYEIVNNPAFGPIAVDEIEPTSARVTAEVDPNQVATTAYVEFSSDGFQWTQQPGHDLGSGDALVSFEENLTGLRPNIDYQVRVSAENDRGVSLASDPIPFKTDASTPFAYSGGAAPRTQTTARVNGWVNPRNSATTYYFEFGSDTSYGASLPATPQEVGSGEEQIPVSAELNGLAPGATYHFRLVAENVAGKTLGSDRVFTTRTAAEPGPRARGIELVNNPDKGNQVAQWPEGGPVANRDATRILWSTNAGAPGGSTGAGSTFMAQRTPNGWRSTNILPPADRLIDRGESRYQPQMANSSFDDFLFEISSGIQARPPRKYGSVDLAGRQEYKGEVGALSSTPVPVRANDDFSRVYSPGSTADGTEQVMEVTADPSRVVSILEDGEPSDCGIDFGGAGGQFANFGGYEWMSTDPVAPSRVFFESRIDAACDGSSKLFMRDVDAGTTTLISGPALPGGPQEEDGMFVRASADGSRVIFATSSRLTPEDTNDVGDIYRYELGTGSTCLTCVGPGAGILVTSQHYRAMVASRDLSRIYFEAPNLLVPGVGEQGASNLYAWHEGQIDYVGSSKALGDNQISEFSQAQVAMADGGRTIFFVSFDPDITTDETGETRQVYRYSEVDSSLECVSCKSGVTPTSNVGSGHNALNAELNLGIDNIAENGSAAVFLTEDALVPDDVNGDLDIYEWRNGEIGLVTDGVTQYPSGTGQLLLYGIGEDGANVVFQAGVNLTGYERDNAGQVYVARAGGGFPPPPGRPAPCGEESCQGPLQAPPGLSAPGSASVSGHGNAREEGAAAKPRKRCVAKPRKGGKASRAKACGKKKAKSKKKSANRKQGGNR